MFSSLAIFIVISTLLLGAHAVPSRFESQPEPSTEQPMPQLSDQAQTSSTHCIDERYLRAKGYSSSDFVHKTPRTAHVLCPPGTLPCGTPHHKVRVDKTSISYQELCDRLASCEVQNISVNSVFSHIWDEETHDNGVVLTMYDNRYPELAQRALHWAVKYTRRVSA